MSTFNGYLREFPDIAIDFFRDRQPHPPPKALFLSHVHTDHLRGLDTYKNNSFVYCSKATKELLLKLQTKHDRVNLAEGVLEKPNFRYRNLSYRKDLLRVLPMETPTVIDIGGPKIRITLFDANHCPGACMFLIEGNGKAVLYTGDFRAETWWRNSLARNAALLPYLNSKVKKLDCIYLDTTFASKDPRCMHFISKTESAMSLVEEMAKYPDDTFFHFNAWTLGYEELWLAVANAFDFKIHVDRYRNSLFHSIRSPDSYNHGPFLAGYSYINNQKPNANQDIEGMLTQNPTTRFHSCEATGSCPVRDDAKKQKRLIQIVPYVTWSEHNISLRRIVAVRKGGLEETANILSEFAKERVIPEREEVQKVAKRLSIDLSPERKAILWEKLDDLDGTVIKEPGHTVLRGTKLEEDGEDLPSIIYIPYSRHSSLSELQDFVGLFRPTTVFPCVADNERLFYLDMKDCFANYVSGNFTFFNEMLLCQHRDSVVDSRIILERVLQEKWAYDDLDIDTDGEELSIESLELETSETQTSFSKVLAMAAEPALKIQQLKKELADDMPIEDTTKDPTGSYISSNSQTQRSGEDTSQESVFYYESETADPEKVEFWKEWIERGCEIKMSCVKWPTVEVEL